MKASIKIKAPLVDVDDFNELANQANQLKPTSGYKHRLESHFSGTLPTKKIGSGMDYAESRVYQAGDDPRFINWRLTARSNETLVKNFHTESSPTLCVLMDRGTTMCFGTRRRLKVTQAARVSTLLGLASRQHRLALSGLVLCDDKNTKQWFPSNTNDQAFNSWNTAVTAAYSPLANNSDAVPKKDWQQTLRDLADKNPSGSLVYLVSDFIGLNEKHQSILEALQTQHYVIAIHVSDIAEQNLSNNGTLRFRDSQSNMLYQVESSSQKQRANFHRQAQQYQQSIQQLFEDRGITYISILTTDENLSSLIPLPLEAI